jgi:phage-related protein
MLVSVVLFGRAARLGRGESQVQARHIVPSTRSLTSRFIQKLVYFGSRMKPVEFLGDSLDRLRLFPREVRRAAGFQLDRVQRGLEPFDWKPMTSVGAGACEIRIRAESGAYRVLYVAKFDEAVFVLHCFDKKTRTTSKRDLELAARRYRELNEEKK